MIRELKNKVHKTLQNSDRIFKTDMVYLAKGGSWLTAGHFISSAAAFILAIAFANLLPQNIFGTYKYVLSVASILTVPTLAGINAALSQAVARGYEGSFKPGLKTKLMWGIWGGIASLIIALYYFLNANTTLAISFLIVAVFVPFFETFNIYTSLLEGRKLFRNSVSYFTITRIGSLAAIFGTLFFTDNLFILLFAYFASWTFLRLAFLLITLYKFSLNDRKDNSTIPYGKHLSLTGVVGKISNYLDNLLLFHYLGAAQVAIYAFAFAPIEQIRAVYKSIPLLAVPKLANRTFSEINNLLYKRLFQLFMVGIVIAVLYALAAPFLFNLLFPKYTESIFFSQLLAIVLALRLPMSFIGAVVHSKLDITPKSWLYIRTIPPMIFIVMLMILTPLYGIIGVIESRIIFLLSSFMISMTQWQRLTKMHSA